MHAAYIMLIVIQIVLVRTIYLPTYIKSCKITDEECLRKNVLNVIQQIKHGDKNLNLNPIDTLKIDDMVAKATPTEPYVSLTSIRAIGLVDTPVVASIKVSLDPCHINLHLSLLNFTFTYDVTIRGKYKSADVDVFDTSTRSSGAMHFPMFMQCEILEKDGVTYINIASLAVDVSYDNPKYSFSKEENNAYLPLLDDIRLYSSGDLVWDHYILDVANKIFNNVPVNQLFKY